MFKGGKMKLSIIVPVYNAEHFLDKCIKSVQSQTLQDFELILVNDGSKDNSLEICKKYSQEDSRIIVFNQENSGQSKARNVGLENANGEYIAFLDSDDWVDSDYYERLVVACEKNEAEVSCGSILRVRKNYQKYRIKYTEEKVYTNSQEKIDIAHVPDMCYVWNKVYKKEFLDRINLKFVEGMFFEDVDFVTRAVYFSNKIVTVPDTYYHYWTNRNSTVKTMKISDKKRADSLKSKEMVLKFFKEHNLKSKARNLIKRKTSVTIGSFPLLKIYEWETVKRYYLFNCIPILEVMTYA